MALCLSRSTHSILARIRNIFNNSPALLNPASVHHFTLNLTIWFKILKFLSPPTINHTGTPPPQGLTKMKMGNIFQGEHLYGQQHRNKFLCHHNAYLLTHMMSSEAALCIINIYVHDCTGRAILCNVPWAFDLICSSKDRFHQNSLLAIPKEPCSTAVPLPSPMGLKSYLLR